MGDEHDTTFQLSEKIIEANDLNVCSNGRALQGILLTKKLEDQLEARQQLLEVPVEFSISSPSFQSRDIIKQFSSLAEEKCFKKKMSILGSGIVMSDIPVYSNHTISKTDDDYLNSLDHENDNIYCSTVKYSILQIATYSFKRTNLKLSQRAKSALNELMESLNDHEETGTNVDKQCMQFFHEYGSHVNLGPLTYGGHMLWTCSTNGFDENSIDALKEIQQNIITTTANTSIALGVNPVEIDRAPYRYLYADDSIVNTQLNVDISVKATNASQFSSELMENKSAWILTDRGEKLMAIWDLIKINHKVEFQPLIKVLRDSWEKMTGLIAERDLDALLSYTPEDELVKVSKWNEEIQPTPEQILERLEHLLTVKKDILDKSANLSLWTNSYLFNPIWQKFLLSVIHMKLDSSHSEHIIAIMKELVELEDLDQLNLPDFPDMKKVSDWLYQSPIDFEGFNENLKKILEDMKQPDSFESLTKKVEKEIRRLRFHYPKTYDDILITILTSPFQSSTGSDGILKLKCLSLANLQLLIKDFFKERAEFISHRENILHLQSYLLLLVINRKSNIPNFKALMLKISEMMEEVQPPSERELLWKLKRHLHADDPSAMIHFKTDLESLMKSSNSKITRQSSVVDYHSLKYALQTELAKKKLVPDDSQESLAEINSVVAHALLEKLGLSMFYPKILCLQDALCIKPEPLKLSLSGSPPTDGKQLCSLVLHKLMSYDSQCRSDLMPPVQHLDNDSKQTPTQNKAAAVAEDDDDDYTYSDEEENLPSSDQNNITVSLKGAHPMDCLLALVLCSDDFLCQDLFSRMAKCQLAIPFLLPDPFTKKLNLRLWAMRSIIKEWNVMNKKKEKIECTEPIVHYPMPIVSFIRFGKHQHRGASKSSILNMVISDSHNNFFFHRDCLINQYNRVLGEGLVDMCCYLPTGKPNDLFPDAVNFLNLHGDSRKYPDQTRFLSQISSMCFVLLSEKDLEFDSVTMESLEKFDSSLGGIVILNDIEEKPKMLKKKFPKISVTNLFSKTSAEITDNIRKKINKKLEDRSHCKPLEELCIGREGISVDEESKPYKDSLKHFNSLKSVITNHEDKNLSVKKSMLPLHGEDLWKAWAACDKELHRHINRGSISVNDYTAKIGTEKARLRYKQLQHVDSLTHLMELFIQSLLKFGEPSNRMFRNYFLQCLKLELNTLSRVNISGMQNQYQSKRKALSLLQESTDQDSKVAENKSIKLKEELEGLQENIISFSFGLEHLFRELGQVYEAALESQEYDEGKLSRLPKAAAELLIDGYPLELMDGDAAHVPLEWVTAVLKEAVKILKDPKVFVLSVLGLQSTGKSTMLNTTFGVQFNVSAGRCTRGAFMQLLSLDKEMERNTGCSYVLVIDTEGLRAPEHDPQKTQKHDNELATFVIGLANTTLINIYGEVPGDMDDILQTSVHAFLRMTEVKYSPSCQFVHQNTGGSIKSEVGRAKFTKKLNQFTLDAAREEQREGQYKCFNDVIRFNDQTDVHYFPGLWEGDPPMAPVNKGYSSAAQALKQRIIAIVCDIYRARKTDLSLSSFEKRVSDLWNTLLKEKFVFSFKNTLEIIAYTSLEAAYGQWAWMFQEKMLKWELETENEINSEPSKSVPTLILQKIILVREYALKDLYQPLKEEMEEFFKGNQSEILIQWKTEFEIRLNHLSGELLSHAEEHCNKLLKSKQAISKFQTAIREDAEYIKKRVQQHLLSIKKEQQQLKSGLEKKMLKPEQLEKLLKRELFAPKKVEEYVRKQLIIPSQEIQIMSENIGQLTEDSLKNILIGGILTEDQVKQIFKEARQTDRELRTEFECIWKDMTSTLVVTSPIEPVPVADMVSEKLIEFVRRKGFDGKLISKLKKKTLREWGKEFDFIPEESKHFNKIDYGFMKRSAHYYRVLRSQTDPDLIEAILITEKILSKLCLYVHNLLKNDTDFNAAFTSGLLNFVDKEITEESKSVQQMFKFTKEFRLVMYMIASGYAIPKFEEMAELFRRENNPLVYLENHVKEPEFIKFKNQYHETEAEEAIADTLCAYLKEPIRVQIGKSLGRDMVTKMKSSAEHFSSKMALKVKVLTDLQEKDTFEDYIIYVRNVRKCLESHIQDYTMKYCDEKLPNGSYTRLQEAARDEVTRLTNIVEEIVFGVDVVVEDLEDSDTEEEDSEDKENNEDTIQEEGKQPVASKTKKVNIQMWLSELCNNRWFQTGLGVKLEPKDLLSGRDSSHKIDISGFIKKIKGGLKELEKTLHHSLNNIQCEQEMIRWKDKPHEILKSLVGCTEQCPFCGEQCDILEPDHVKNGHKHKTNVHRLDCLAGWRDKQSQVMVTNFCPVVVAGEGLFYKKDDTLQPYSRYQEVYEDWSIPPDKSSKDSLYWKWFVAKYKDSLAIEFNAHPPEVPHQWHSIDWKEVKKNLKKVYNL